ncbi:MAG: anti-sigma regulatory factor [Clostridiaceae bacterium]|nr:anti-sigma regulatory factor [Clostridiaceae bacterium]
MNDPNTISLNLPAKAEYVSVARLTASGISSSMGFDFDAIEDIKVSISEVLGKIIEKTGENRKISIIFEPRAEGLKIKFLTNDDTVSNVFDGEDDSFSLAIVEALMDQVDLQKNGEILVTVVKKLGKAV